MILWPWKILMIMIKNYTNIMKILDFVEICLQKTLMVLLLVTLIKWRLLKKNKIFINMIQICLMIVRQEKDLIVLLDIILNQVEKWCYLRIVNFYIKEQKNTLRIILILRVRLMKLKHSKIHLMITINYMNYLNNMGCQEIYLLKILMELFQVLSKVKLLRTKKRLNN